MPAAAWTSALASSKLPKQTSAAPSASSASACSGLRMQARTCAPFAANAFTTALPLLPAAPVTRIIASSLEVSSQLCRQRKQAVGSEGDLVQLDLLVQKPERILDRLREQRPDRNGAGFARALDAKRIKRRFRHCVRDLHVRHFEGRRQQVVGKRGVEQLAVVIEHELLVEGIADALRHAAVNLTGKDQRIDDRAAVMHHDVFEDVKRKGLRIDLDDHGMHAACGGA